MPVPPGSSVGGSSVGGGGGGSCMPEPGHHVELATELHKSFAQLASLSSHHTLCPWAWEPPSQLPVQEQNAPPVSSSSSSSSSNAFARSSQLARPSCSALSIPPLQSVSALHCSYASLHLVHQGRSRLQRGYG